MTTTQCCVVPSSKAAFRQSNKSTAINAALFLFQDAPKTTVDKLKIAREWLDEHPLVGCELDLLLFSFERGPLSWCVVRVGDIWCWQIISCQALITW